LSRVRLRGWAVAACAAIGAFALVSGIRVVRPRLERAVRARIEAAAARRGLVARIGAVRVGLWPPVRLTSVELESRGRWRLEVESVEAWWPGRTRLDLGRSVLQGPAGLTAIAEPTTWDVAGLGRSVTRAELVRPVSGLVLSHAATPDGETTTITATDAPAAEILEVRRSGRPWLALGTVRGSLRLQTSAEEARFELDAAARDARPPALGGAEDDPLGELTEVAARVSGFWSRRSHALEVPHWRTTAYGAALSGSLSVRDLGGDPSLELSLEVERMDFARVLRTSGLGAPPKLDPTAGLLGRPGDLGSASLSARARGRVSDPASFVVSQRLDFTPPRPMPPAVERLKGSFVHEVVLPTGATQAIDVSPASPDFIPLSQVPPLFLRALLLGEDAGFYGHPGIDLREIPSALLTDWARGGAARGASTITQQLAKNLFLTGEKHLGRKVQELSLALLLESALGKQRILEVYLNVIEWGPGLYGLRPAARTYFAKEPQQLSPAQMAFLVSLIPGPIKYQSSFSHGTPVPGFRQLVDALLAKLRAVEALTEDEYQHALVEEIRVEGRGTIDSPVVRESAD
jgi:hypothetical protein